MGIEGYIKLHRKIVDWEWYTDANTCRLFLHCLLKANHKDKQWQGQKIKRGSFVTSYEKLASELRLTIQQTRTAINHLKSTNELTYQSTRQYSIITVNNYKNYQHNDKQTNNQTTHEQQTDNKQVTTTKNDKNEKNNILSGKIILSYLNEKVNKQFKPTESNLKFITARLDEYTNDELKRVIDFKAKDWQNDSKMSKYLRPETLFNATKCASYVEESREDAKEVKYNAYR